MFKVDRNSIRNWVDQVAGWSVEEKENALTELKTSRNQECSLDILDVNHKLRKTFSDNDSYLDDAPFSAEK